MPHVTECPICNCPNLKWLAVTVVARYTLIPSRTLRYRLESRMLRGRKVGKFKWLIEHKSLDAWLRSVDNRYDPYVESNGRKSA